GGAESPPRRSTAARGNRPARRVPRMALNRAGLTARRHRPLQVAAVILVLYGIWIGAYLAFQGDVRDFIRIGTIFIARGYDRSTEIHVDPGYSVPANQNRDHPGLRYDGQFAYYLALDPSRARYY